MGHPLMGLRLSEAGRVHAAIMNARRDSHPVAVEAIVKAISPQQFEARYIDNNPSAEAWLRPA